MGLAGSGIVETKAEEAGSDLRACVARTSSGMAARGELIRCPRQGRRPTIP